MKRMSWLAIAGVGLVVGFLVASAFNGGDAKSVTDLLSKLVAGASASSPAAPPPRGNETIRVATFNIQVFGEAKLADEESMRTIVGILQNFDLVAIQEVRAVSQDVLPRLIERLNAGGKFQYHYAIGPRLGHTNSKEQYAFVYDLATIEISNAPPYTVDDPDQLLHRPPFVSLFRARGPPAEQAFTFTLATIHTDPDEVNLELDVLDDVFYAIRNDGRLEDDVIVLGDFNARSDNLRHLGQIPGLVKVVTGSTPTNTLRTAQYDNIVFDGGATSEFTGRGGVYDFMRDPQFNLTQEQAERVSDHLPVWAEFSVYEGGRPGPIAARPLPIQ